ncbi:Crp/Fnr family transcriptional regulator [Streptomyces ruber]|uniref:Crp/Fnr family transcriptional regulator n=2 Tax=Streptomyces TaxID=1883 RepID=A0A918EU86_9ACTN|nr:Crp/Fnr family transcriptional regulator [Streptomyces ruber]GGQ65540.1 Crp/Fnr family transcriptional regulator [Streptomyces ruber]
MTAPAADRHDPRGNRVLAALPEAERQRLRHDLEPVRTQIREVVHRPGRPVEAVLFPLRAVFSILADLDGGTVEVATVGDEGMVGLSAFLGVTAPTERAVCQVAGWGLRMDADRFRHEIGVLDGALQQVLQRYTQFMFTQLARNAACNRGHRIPQRCARWLLMTADRMHSDRFALTQEFLAQMLAVRRTSVSEAAGALARAGCIRYSRGVITVLDRTGLESHACTCYRVLREAADTVLPPAADVSRAARSAPRP